MDYVIYIPLFILSISTILLAFALHAEKKKGTAALQKLDELKAHSDNDLYGRGKFSELGLLSAGITHEISNPLTVILGKVDQLSKPEREISKEDYLKGLQLIRKNAERIETIVQSVRKYIYRNEETVEDFIPVKEIIDNVMVFYGQRLKNHGIELRLNNVEDVYISGHRGQFEQALLNLISNAFDAVVNLEEKWIEISAAKSDEYIRIYVKDSGYGIPQTVRAKMMDPFFTTKDSKGTGLGLTLVKGIAKNHGGDLRYDDHDRHTTFILEIPKSSGMLYHH